MLGISESSPVEVMARSNFEGPGLELQSGWVEDQTADILGRWNGMWDSRGKICSRSQRKLVYRGDTER